MLVVPLEISPVADHLATLNPQESQVSRCGCCGPGGCGVTGDRRYCHGFGYVYYYEPVLGTQPTGVTGIYGECRPGPTMCW